MKNKYLKIIGWIPVSVLFFFFTISGHNPNQKWRGANVGTISFPVDVKKASSAIVPRLDKLSIEEFHQVQHISAEYNIDYRLILAMIEQESQFDNMALSSRGATGLMQLMPLTGGEVAEYLNLDESEQTFGNIKIGIHYFSKLLNLFHQGDAEDKLCLTLAAYNAGPSRIYDAQVLAAYIGEDPQRWSSIQRVLPLLSKRFSSLHQSVWESGKPKSGYFGSWRQTIYYVENTLRIYKDYLRLRD